MAAPCISQWFALLVVTLVLSACGSPTTPAGAVEIDLPPGAHDFDKTEFAALKWAAQRERVSVSERDLDAAISSMRERAAAELGDERWLRYGVWRMLILDRLLEKQGEPLHEGADVARGARRDVLARRVIDRYSAR